MSDQPKPPYEFGHGAPGQQPAPPPFPPQGGPPPASSGDPDAMAMARVQPIIAAAEQASTAIIAEAEAQAQRYVQESRQRADEIAAARAREMWSVADELIARGEAVRQRSDELLAALAYAKQGLEQALGASSPAPPQPSVTPQLPPQPAQQAPPIPPQPAPQPPPQQPAQPAVQQPPPPMQAPAPPAMQTPAPPPAPAPPAMQAPPTPAPSPPPAPVSQPSEGARLLATQMAVAGSSRDEIASRLFNEFGVQEPGLMLDAILGPAA